MFQTIIEELDTLNFVFERFYNQKKDKNFSQFFLDYNSVSKYNLIYLDRDQHEDLFLRKRRKKLWLNRPC